MVGLLSSVSSVLSGATGLSAAGGQSEEPSSASTTTTQTFTSGSMGSGDMTIVYVLLGLVLLAIVIGKVRV
jgi:hypothetical protein